MACDRARMTDWRVILTAVTCQAVLFVCLLRGATADRAARRRATGPIPRAAQRISGEVRANL